MYAIAQHVQQWLAEGRVVHVAQVVATRGFSSSDPGAALAWTEGGAVGALLPMIDEALLATDGQIDGHLVEIEVSDADGVAAGLSCGGVATVLVQPATEFADDTWDRLAQREPLCLLTEIVGSQPARTETFGPATVRDAAARRGAAEVPRLFARGVSDTQVLPVEGETLIVVTLWPPTTLVVVGHGSIASALADSGNLLGWTVEVVPEPDPGVLRDALTESDALLVLSHDREVDGPALQAALAGRCGYIGALGSRRTQQARAEWLTERGVSPEEQSRIYGPAGLDIDAHTPAEISVSIVAEILASRSLTSGGSLRDREGPVHLAGVNAPPPRYES